MSSFISNPKMPYTKYKLIICSCENPQMYFCQRQIFELPPRIAYKFITIWYQKSNLNPWFCDNCNKIIGTIEGTNTMDEPGYTKYYLLIIKNIIKAFA